ncbi:MAG TPA: FlgD immunoglobulin-like domain containing protein, partial [Actinomycetota bacterium]|nr:FlgD immunoglobulin-like domain containing protein [Actinomycetota bacterium]
QDPETAGRELGSDGPRADESSMRRLAVLAGSFAIGIVLVVAVPASAAHEVTIDFPGNVAEYYSPFDGPATIEITVDAADVDDTFTAKLKSPGGSVLDTTRIPVLNEDADGVVTKAFRWDPLSVTGLKQYTVAVYRNGAEQASESFFLRPKLVTITDITPDPFLPKIDDGVKDVTHVRFSLAAAVQDAEVQIFAPKSTGVCCGSLLRVEALGALSEGANTWDWDGRDEEDVDLPKGGYWVRVWADDGTLAPVLSKAVKVSIARSYRATDTMQKPARQYHHVGAITPLHAAGDCRIYLYDGQLRILCQTAKVTVYWRWGLDAGEKIVKARFVIENPSDGCPTSIRSAGFTKHESWFQVNDDVAGIAAKCNLETAKITYSYLQPS